MLTIRQVFNDLLLLLGYDDADNAAPADRTRVFNDIQAALQAMQNAGEDFYAREPLTVTLAAGTAAYTLGDGVQAVLEGARMASGQPLRKLTSRAQFMQFGQLFLGQLDNTLDNGTPLAYFTESLRVFTAGTSSAAGENVKIVIHFAPPPDAAGTATLDVINEPPLYTMDDLCGTSPIIPVPHKFSESIFLPLARWNLATHPKFYKKELLPKLEADYDRAVQLLGQADPRRPKPGDSSADALAVRRSRQPQSVEEVA